MVTVCAWCQKYLGLKDPVTDPTVTHGICPTCARRQQIGAMPTLVIAREHAETLPVFQSLLTGTPEVPVVVDRRMRERRRESPPSDEPDERRQAGDRRQKIRLFLV